MKSNPIHIVPLYHIPISFLSLSLSHLSLWCRNCSESSVRSSLINKNDLHHYSPKIIYIFNIKQSLKSHYSSYTPKTVPYISNQKLSIVVSVFLIPWRWWMQWLWWWNSYRWLIFDWAIWGGSTGRRAYIGRVRRTTAMLPFCWCWSKPHCSVKSHCWGWVCVDWDIGMDCSSNLL